MFHFTKKGRNSIIGLIFLCGHGGRTGLGCTARKLGNQRNRVQCKVHIENQTTEGFCRKAGMILGNSKAEDFVD